MRHRLRLRTRDDRGSTRRDDRGSAILEFTGFLPILLLVGMAAIQLGLVGYAFEQAATAARAAARAESLEEGTGDAAADASVSGFLNPETGFTGGDTVTATVTIEIPALIPFVGDLGDATRSVTMPRDED